MSFKKVNSQEEIDRLINEYVSTRKELQEKSIKEETGVQLEKEKAELITKPIVEALIGPQIIVDEDGLKIKNPEPDSLLSISEGIRDELNRQGVDRGTQTQIMRDILAGTTSTRQLLRNLKKSFYDNNASASDVLGFVRNLIDSELVDAETGADFLDEISGDYTNIIDELSASIESNLDLLSTGTLSSSDEKSLASLILESSSDLSKAVEMSSSLSEINRSISESSPDLGDTTRFYREIVEISSRVGREREGDPGTSTALRVEEALEEARQRRRESENFPFSTLSEDEAFAEEFLRTLPTTTNISRDTTTGSGMPLKIGAGHGGQKRRHAYKIDEFGNFGILKIDVPTFQNYLRLRGYLDGQLMVDQIVDKDTFDLLTKRFNPRRKYSKESIKIFQNLVDIAKLPLYPGSKKFQLLTDEQKRLTIPTSDYGIKRPKAIPDISKLGGKILKPKYVKVVQSDDELIERLGFIIAGMKAGNTSKLLKSEVMDIIDILLKKSIISPTEHKAILNKYVL